MPPNFCASSVEFGDHRVDDVVDGDDAEHLHLLVDDGQRQQVVPADQPRDLFLRQEGIGRHRRARLRDRDDRRLRLAHDEPAQRDDVAERMALGIDHIDRVDRFARALDMAHVLDRLCDGPAGGHRDELRRHDAAGGARRIAHQPLDRQALVHVEAADEPGAARLSRLGEDVGHAVAGRAVEQEPGALGRKPGDDLCAAGQLRPVDDADRLVIGEPCENAHGGLHVEPVQPLDALGDGHRPAGSRG